MPTFLPSSRGSETEGEFLDSDPEQPGDEEMAEFVKKNQNAEDDQKRENTVWS